MFSSLKACVCYPEVESIVTKLILFETILIGSFGSNFYSSSKRYLIVLTAT